MFQQSSGCLPCPLSTVWGAVLLLRRETLHFTQLAISFMKLGRELWQHYLPCLTDWVFLINFFPSWFYCHYSMPLGGKWVKSQCRWHKRKPVKSQAFPYSQMLYKHVRVQQLTSQHQLRITSTKSQRITLIPLQSISSTTGSWLVKNIKCQDVRRKYLLW